MNIITLLAKNFGQKKCPKKNRSKFLSVRNFKRPKYLQYSIKLLSTCFLRPIYMIELELGLGFSSLERKTFVVFYFMKKIMQINSFFQYMAIFLIQAQIDMR